MVIWKEGGWGRVGDNIGGCGQPITPYTGEELQMK
jgi:hypothetical protein